jgi:hypothetical protein
MVAAGSKEATEQMSTIAPAGSEEATEMSKTRESRNPGGFHKKNIAALKIICTNCLNFEEKQKSDFCLMYYSHCLIRLHTHLIQNCIEHNS